MTMAIIIIIIMTMIFKMQMIMKRIVRNIDNKINCRIIDGYTAFDIIDGKIKAPLLFASGK